MGAALAIDPLHDPPTEPPERRLSPAEEARLVRENEKLVHFWARRIKISSYEDAVQAGMIGLLTAIRKFEPERGFKLSTYATYWIRQAIQRHEFLQDQKGDTPNMYRARYMIRTAVKQLRAEGVEQPTIAQVSHRTGIKTQNVAALLEWQRSGVQSLDAPLGDETDSALYEMVAGNGPEPEELAAESEAMASLREEIATFERLLPHREAAVFRARVLAVDPPTLEEVGQQFEVTRERIRQIETLVINKFERFMRKRHSKALDVRAALAEPVAHLRTQAFDLPVEAAVERIAPAPVRSVSVNAQAAAPPAAKGPEHRGPTCAKCGAPLSVRSLKEGYDKCGVCRDSGPEKNAARAIPDNPITGSGRVRAPGTGNVFCKKGRWYAKQPESVTAARRYAPYIGSFATPEEAHAACDKWVEENGGPKVDRNMPTCSIPGCTTTLQGRSLEKGDGLCGVHRQKRERSSTRGAEGVRSSPLPEPETPAPQPIEFIEEAPKENPRALVIRTIEPPHEPEEPLDPIADARAFVARRNELEAKLRAELDALEKRKGEIEELLVELRGHAPPPRGAEPERAESSYSEGRREAVKALALGALRSRTGKVKGREVVHDVQRRDGTIHHTRVYQALYALVREKRIRTDDGQNHYWLPTSGGVNKSQ